MKNIQKLCKYCKYWRNATAIRESGRTFKVGECKCPKFSYDVYYHDGLHYHDIEDHNAYIDTGEHFGCVHFAPKKNT